MHNPNIVICVIVGCSNRSDCSSNQDQSNKEKFCFFSIPTVTCHQGKEEKEVKGWVFPYSIYGFWQLFYEKILTSKHSINTKHFISKQPAYLYDTSNPDWLPTLHLGHTKSNSVQEENIATSVARFERVAERSKRRETIDNMIEQLPSIVADLLDLAIQEECRLICAEQIKIGREYIRFEEHQGER